MNPVKSLAALNPAKKAFSLFDEFKNFAFKGNVIDLAIGVIIGAAFGKIVDSLVKDILMPLIAPWQPGEGDYTQWQWRGVHYGAFIGQVVNFLIIAAILFAFIVKFLGWIMHLKKQEVVAPPPPTKDQELLMEIRDLLKRQQPPTSAGSLGAAFTADDLNKSFAYLFRIFIQLALLLHDQETVPQLEWAFDD